MNKELLEGLLIFSDGACSGNPGPGGWACVIASPEGKVRELAGHEEQTTNNRMELQAAIEALIATKNREEKVFLFTDSTYLIQGITEWIWGWRSKGWVTAEGKEVLNRDMWEQLSRLVGARKGKIDWLYSRGHVGTPGNERCDELAVAYSQKKYVSLYNGSLLKYPVEIYQLPEDTSLPPRRTTEKKAPAYSYLSLIGRQVIRHKDWASCERRVKGQSGAKFKKAATAGDEKEILKSWNLDPSTSISDDK